MKLNWKGKKKKKKIEKMAAWDLNLARRSPLHQLPIVSDTTIPFYNLKHVIGGSGVVIALHILKGGYFKKNYSFIGPVRHNIGWGSFGPKKGPKTQS